MQYVSFGRGSRKLVILPGLSDGLATVKGKALLLAPPYRRYFDRFTIYMFSRKDVMPAGYSIRDMAADQAAAIKALGLCRVSVMGVSQGGMIAQVLAADYPEIVEKLVIAVSAPRISDMTRSCVEGWIEMARRGDHRQLMIDTAEKSYSAARLKQYRKLYPFLRFVGKPKNYDRFLANAEAILGFDTDAVTAGRVGGDVLSRITCPTLIISGEEDRIVGVQGSYEMHEGIAGSRLYVYPGLGHAAYEEAPDFNERVFGFLEE